ncbi:MAG TPA: AIR synthase family protein [Aequorivita sp.]|nr:AIR synthase family protein [Aequorivita sp.]
MKEQTGKIAHSFFKQFVQDKCGKKRQEIRVGPQFGVDVSVIDLPNGQAIAMASDPLSLIPTLGLRESAYLSVHLVANDIATTGFPPMYGQFVLNLPAQFSQKDFQTYWDYIHQFCSESNIAITGGHTGFIEEQNSTIAGGATFVTIAKQNQLLTSKSAEPGDAILVTKSCAISSVAILAKSFPKTVKNKAGIEHYQNACESFYDISVLKDALIATDGEKQKEVTAMHDVTEGGVLGAIYEMAIASDNGAIIYNDKLPVGETQSQVCEVFSLDSRYCIGAGAMVITCKKNAASKIITKLGENNIPCTEVGEITEKNEGIKLNEKGRESDLIYCEKDPYWEAFFKALKSGWK